MVLAWSGQDVAEVIGKPRTGRTTRQGGGRGKGGGRWVEERGTSARLVYHPAAASVLKGLSSTKFYPSPWGLHHFSFEIDFSLGAITCDRRRWRACGRVFT